MYVVKAGCPGCGNCKGVCPVGAVEPEGIGVKITESCVDCGVCAAACPVRLIEPAPRRNAAAEREPEQRANKKIKSGRSEG